MRSALKAAIEGLLAHGGPAAIARATRRRGALVLAYHNILPDGVVAPGDRSLHLARARFSEQLDELLQHLDIVPLAELGRPHAGNRPRAVITFDDAYRGAVTAGVRELVRRGLPGTIFVTPGLLGDHTFWWDACAGPNDLAQAVRSHALDVLRGEDKAVRDWVATQGRPLAEAPAAARSATEAELDAALRCPGITAGSHTWSHPSLARLTDAELRAELTRSRDWLSGRYGDRFVPWLTYPYGAWSPAVAEAAREVGYAGAFRVEGGWSIGQVAGDFAIPRLNVPAGLSADGFALRAAGLLAG